MKSNRKKVSMFVSEVRRRHGVLRYLWPFWSRCQLIVFVATSAVYCVVLAVLARDLSGMLGYATGALVGGLAARGNRWMPSQLIITTRGEASRFLTEVDALLLRQSYQRSDEPAPGGVHYRSLAPKWVNWGEQDVTVRVERHQITLDGPIGVLWLTHHSVTTRDDA